MEREHDHKKLSISHINYHLIFCPRYRRKVFREPGFEKRFKELVHETAETHDFVVHEITCGEDYCHIHVKVPPEISAEQAVRAIKTGTASALLREFRILEKSPTLWTRNYFASTEKEVGQKEINGYVGMQKKRG